MQTDDHRKAAEDLLGKLGGAQSAPELWVRDRMRSRPYEYSPQPWLERAIAAALLLKGDEKVLHARILRPGEGLIRLAILTEKLLLLSEALDSREEIVIAPMTAVPRRALRSLAVVAEQGVIVRESIITGPEGYVVRDAHSWPGTVSLAADYEGFGQVSIVGPGEESDYGTIRGFVDALREDLTATK